MISQTYDLNLIPSQIPVTIHCSQYDDGSRTFVFNLYEGASAFEIPTGASATFSGVKPDGLGFQYACAITGASQVSVDVALQMTAVAGDCPCKVTVYDTDSNILGSALCVLDVERHPLQDDTVISDSDIPLVQEAVNWAAQFQPSDFVAKNQGVAQAGKVLGIGADGMVTPVQGGGGGGDTMFYDSLSDFPAIGEEDTLYVAKDTNQMYRWRTAVNAYINVGGGDAENVTYWRQDYPDVSLALDALFGRTDLSYKVDDTSDTTIDDADYVPFYDTSASAKKKITWSNIVTKIKTSLANYFGRKFSQSNGKLNLLAEDNTLLDTVTLSPLASNTSYTDTNNIGAANVQSAVDFFGAYSEGQASINTTYLSGQVNWQKIGRVVSVALEVSIIANLPSTNWEVALISGLPPVLCPMSWVRRWTLPATDQTKKPLILGATATTTMPQTALYSWGNGSVTSGTQFSASFTYICK